DQARGRGRAGCARAPEPGGAGVAPARAGARGPELLRTGRGSGPSRPDADEDEPMSPAKTAAPTTLDAPTRSPAEAAAGPKRWVYFFGDGHAEGNARMRDLLGGKGAGIAEMVNAGIPVPPGYTITTEACRRFFEAGGKLLDSIVEEEEKALARLEKFLGRRLGDPQNPLLV